jgi:lipopolysaccharide transport system permease protein
MVVFTVFFSNVAKISSNGIPYPLFSFAALVPWTFFSNGVSLGADSIVGQAHLVRKVYFPRILIPLARILGGMVDFLLALAILIAMMFFYGYGLNLTTLLAIPFLSLMLVLIALGISLWLSALNVSYRDVRYLVPFLIQLLLFATPVIYPSTLIDKSARIFYGLNPMVNVVDGFRWALLDTPSPPGLSVAISLALSVVLLISGLLFFSRAEGTFTDIV